MLYPLNSMTTSNKGHRLLILVVDDEPIIADTIAKILEQQRFSALAAYDGETAIEIALLNPPQLVVSDVMMPGMNGIELGMKIRRMFPDCSVILSSGQSASSNLLMAALSAGNHFVFLEKPVHPKVLLKHVKESLKQA